ncbi:ER membrane protein DP1/Yop1 [Mycoemilia scoparia]|uniref:Protein YOP1 n=1 Tax=Mycoemilia scoparia TaxID=417184 RepID=A0A9W7ZYG0_9FUNG|nr:ER membrane protein DP1/Yop1 [Mycoemilia scoparia]
MEDLKRIYHENYSKIDKVLDQVPHLSELSAKFGVPKVPLGLSAGGVFILLVFFNFAAQLLVNVVGYIFPLFKTIEALESPELDDDKQWLTYWCLFGFFNTIEYFTNFLLYWVPFYYVFKLGFLVWLMAPQFNGARILYLRFISPAYRNFKFGKEVPQAKAD